MSDQFVIEQEPFKSWTAIKAAGLDLAVSAGPVAWGRGRWPSVDWIDGQLIVCRSGLPLAAIRTAGPGIIEYAGFIDTADILNFLDRSMGYTQTPPEVADPVAGALLADVPGLRPWSHGSLARGVLTSIIGQHVSVQAGAVFEQRIAALYAPGTLFGGRLFYPFPDAIDLAVTDPVRLKACGVTGRRAEAIVAIARVVAEGALVAEAVAIADPDAAIRELRRLPLVGPWTASAALLWGLGAPDAHPSGDVAVLRAAKLAYGQPTMTMRELDHLADGWRPYRAWAVRALWHSIFGAAPTVNYR